MNDNREKAAVPAVVNIHNENGQALEVRAALDIKPSLFKAGLERRKKNRDTLIDWVREALVEGTDFGRIHVVKRDVCDRGKWCENDYHFSKPSLWKAGAEKISGMLGLRVAWPTLRDYEDRVIRGEDIKEILLRCELTNADGLVVAEGIGGRKNDGDLNKALKMAKKSGQIDAVLNVGGLSEVFTQDLEDMTDDQLAGSRDPFQPGEDRVESAIPRNQKPLESHCPIGREWKGVPWSEVDDGFLSWIIGHIDDKPDLVGRARKEVELRYPEDDEAKKRRRAGNMTTGKKVSDYARELTEATNLDQIIIIKEELPADFEPSLRTFIATRERELGPE
jgi:hypothetical protein